MVQYRLTASKTKLYALAKRDFPGIEPMRRTEFIRYPGGHSYGLRFWAGACACRLYLAPCCGRVSLAYERSDLDKPGDGAARWESRTLELDELKEFGLLEEIPGGPTT